LEWRRLAAALASRWKRARKSSLVEELDRHVAFEGRLNGFVDPGHAAFTDQFDEFILA
jgi:hypothetical protein